MKTENILDPNHPETKFLVATVSPNSPPFEILIVVLVARSFAIANILVGGFWRKKITP